MTNSSPAPQLWKSKNSISSRTPHNAWYCRHDHFPQFLASHATTRSPIGPEIRLFLQAGISNRILLHARGDSYDASKVKFVVQVDAKTPTNHRGHATERRCVFVGDGRGHFHEISAMTWRSLQPKRVVLDELEVVCDEHGVKICIKVHEKVMGWSRRIFGNLGGNDFPLDIKSVGWIALGQNLLGM